MEKPVNKVRTFSGRNFLMTVLSIPPIFVLLITAVELYTFNPKSFFHRAIGPALLVLLIIGAALAFLGAKKVKHIASTGDLEHAAKTAMSHKKSFAAVMLFSWILGIFVAISAPGMVSYHGRAIDSAAKAELKKLSLSQEEYYADNNSYTMDLGKLNGWSSDPEVTIKMLSVDDNCFSAQARHERGDKIITYNSCDREFKESDL